MLQRILEWLGVRKREPRFVRVYHTVEMKKVDSTAWKDLPEDTRRGIIEAFSRGLDREMIRKIGKKVEKGRKGSICNP